MNHITIRTAKPEDAAHVAELLMLAWPVDEMLESIGISYEELHESITRLVARKGTTYSYENTVVAEVAGKVAGAMCAYNGADYQSLKQPVIDSFGKDSAFANMEETEAGEYYLDSVGVLPEYRGQGIASLLFEEQCRRAASQGHKIAGLIVDEDKPKAEALYTRLGFRHVDNKVFFVRSMKHMVRIL